MVTLQDFVDSCQFQHWVIKGNKQYPVRRDPLVQKLINYLILYRGFPDTPCSRQDHISSYGIIVETLHRLIKRESFIVLDK